MTLPPGQHVVNGFPRFGTHLQEPAPPVPDEPAIEICGAVSEPFSLPLDALAVLPRRELTADFHCVAGWSTTGLRWEGVAFATFYRDVIEPAIRPGATVTHLVFRGLDGYRSLASIEDALAYDVLIAEHLGGLPLDGDHGAPVRLVAPGHYGFVSCKHLCRIELHTAEPSGVYTTPAPRFLLRPHMRARVWKEERHREVPAWALRLPYRLLIPPIAFLSRRGSRSR
ncbi:MAG: molybdopterin-dependent oxidoreductase [Thermoleophilaceae bacterium]|nr:molybdopterin-dependent oxidoreductase [Thermoleophilaceae bacterium]